MLMIVDVHWRSQMCRAPRAIGGELLIATHCGCFSCTGPRGPNP